ASADAIAVGDFNKDGKLDVVVAGNAGLYVLLGNGDGTLQAPVAYSLDGANAVAVVVGDLDNDGNLDLIAATSNQFNRVYILRGAGNGTFQVFANYTTCPIRGLTAVDLNRDGFLDAAGVCYGFTNSLEVMIGGGDGTFAGILQMNPLNVY